MTVKQIESMEKKQQWRKSYKHVNGNDSEKSANQKICKVLLPHHPGQGDPGQILNRQTLDSGGQFPASHL